MKIVIFKQFGDYYTTPESNYNAQIPNARLISGVDFAKDASDIIEYYCKHFGSEKDDFIVAE